MEGSERTMDMTHRRRCKQTDRQDIETEKTTNNNFVYGVEPNKMEGWLRSWIRGWDLGIGIGDQASEIYDTNGGWGSELI
jgi:hypothetical protein